MEMPPWTVIFREVILLATKTQNSGKPFTRIHSIFLTREWETNHPLMERQAKWSMAAKYSFAKELTSYPLTILR